MGRSAWVDRAGFVARHAGGLAPLLAEEEEGLVLVAVEGVRNEDRAADVEAVDVVMRCRPCTGGAVVLVEEVVGVVCGGAIIFPCRAMEVLGAALQRNADGGAGGDAVVGRIVRGHHLELGDGVLRRQNLHAAAAAAVSRLAAVDQPDIVGLAQAVEFDAPVGTKRTECVVVRQFRADAQAKSSQSRKVAVLGGDGGDLFRADQGADHVGVGLHRQGIGHDVDGLCYRRRRSA